MKIHNVTQGSSEWHELRRSCFTASEAPAMMGASKYQSRDDLLKQKATGVMQEVSAAQQALFNRGHATEASIRPYIEMLIGEELYPVTGSIEVAGMTLLASFDGLTMAEDIGFEHKLLNQDLADKVKRGELDPHYYWQLEQQLLVSGAAYIIFVTSNGSESDCYHTRYESIPERRDQLIAGWKQFKEDLANYQAPEQAAPKPVAEPVAALPAINFNIDMTNGISIKSNLDAFKAAAQQLVENSKAILVSDQDFENAKARVKECEKAEANIKSLIERFLGELGDANTFKSDLESIGEFIRQSRLNQDKQIKSRSAERKAEIIKAGRDAVQAHIQAINAKLATVSLPTIPADFDAAVYRKSSFDSMQSGVNDALAAFKIEANRIASLIEVNLELMREIASDYKFLFRDMQQLCMMDKEALRAIALQRIADHKTEEDKRIEAEAQRIANEKIEAEKAAEAKRQFDERAEEARKQQEVVAPREYPTQVLDDHKVFTSEREEVAETLIPAGTQSQVFAPDELEPLADMSDFIAGKHAAFKVALDRYLACKKSGADFEQVLRAFIHSTQPVHKAA